MTDCWANLKEEGNKCFSKHDFNGAVNSYTKAIDACPSEHTLYSNRSISFSKLGKYKEALLDAEKCIELKPNFARGYLRKCTALNGLGRHEDVLEAAQDGYKLRGSDAISRGCIAEWISAIENVFRQKILDTQKEIGPFVPSQCLVTSDDYLTILLNLLVARFNYTTTGVPRELMIAYLFKIFQELNRVLKLFDHKPPQTEDEWIDAVFNASKLDLTTSKVSPTAVAAIFAKSEELAAFLHNEVDHILYPIVSSIMSLAIVAINLRAISLNCLSIDHHVVEVTTSACRVFFEKSLLSSPKYAEQHICLYKEMLEGIALSSHVFSQEDVLSHKASIKKLESLLQQNPDCDREYFEKAMVSIGIIKVRLGENPGFDHVSYGSDHGKSYSKKTLEEMLPFLNSKEEAVRSMLTIPLMDPLPFTTLEDSQSLLSCTSNLIRHGNVSRAIDAFKLSEEAFTRILQHQIISKAFSLDTGPEVILPIQTMMFTYADAFLEVDQMLVVNTIIKWRCIFSEFRALLMQLGMGEKYLNTFKLIQEMNVQKGADEDKSTIGQISERHQSEVQKVMRVKGMILLTSLLKQNYEMIQDELKDGDIVMEYCSWESEYSYSEDGNDQEYNDTTTDGLLLLLRRNHAPVITRIDFKKVVAIARDWIKAGRTSSEVEISKITRPLCDLLIPANVQAELSASGISRILLSLDPTFLLPIELLPLPCGEWLGKKCTLVYLSATRELIRNSTLQSVNRMMAVIEGHKGSGMEEGSTDARLDTSDHLATEDACEPITKQSHFKKNCIIFANPNYDLEQKSISDAGMVQKLAETISALFLNPSQLTGIAKPLPKTKDEAQEIEYILSAATDPLTVIPVLGDDATLSRALQVEVPFMLHFSTHGFSKSNVMGTVGTFWDDTKCGLLLAGANTYYKGELSKVVPEAGTGQLSALAVMGMNLQGTRLVYLSACISAQGSVGIGESINSLAQAFRAAGAQTVVATLWTVFDDEARMFAVHFYYEAIKSGMPPSQALRTAKEKMSDSGYHWVFWSSFICIGEDIPLFPEK